MNQEIEKVLAILPPESQSRARRAWTGLPADVRAELALTYSAFARLMRQKPGSLLDLLRMLQRATGPALGSACKIAIVGPTNVGKSTLFNALLQEQRALTSPVPGTTKSVEALPLGPFQLLDTPGADHGAGVGEAEKALAFEAAEEANFLLITFDARSNVSASDRELFAEWKTLKKPYLVVLNKIDQIPVKERKVVLRGAARILRLPAEAVQPVSALKNLGVPQLVLEMTAIEPHLLGQMGKLLPSLRRRMAWQAVRRSAIASAMISLAPLPVVDMIPLTVLQGSLVTTLARIYDQRLGPKRVLQLGSSFGIGWLARLLFREVSKLGGPPGWVLSASIATSATLTIGYGAINWFETGRRPTPAQLQEYARRSRSWLNIDPGTPVERLSDLLEQQIPQQVELEDETDEKA